MKTSEQPKTYRQIQMQLIASSIICIAFIIVNIHTIFVAHENLRIGLSIASLMVFTVLMFVGVRKLIANYKKRPY